MATNQQSATTNQRSGFCFLFGRIHAETVQGSVFAAEYEILESKSGLFFKFIKSRLADEHFGVDDSIRNEMAGREPTPGVLSIRTFVGLFDDGISTCLHSKIRRRSAVEAGSVFIDNNNNNKQMITFEFQKIT